MDVGIAEVAAVEDHGVVEQAFGVGRGCGGECGDEIAQVPHLLQVHLFELGELLLRLAVVAEIVIAVAGAVLCINLKDRRGETVHHEGDNAGGIGLEGELGHVEHELDLGEELGFVGDVLGLGGLGLRLGFLLPFAGDGESLLQFSHGGQILIETAFVVTAELALEAADVIAHGVEDAATILEAFERGGSLIGIALDEHFAKQGRWAVLGGQQHAIACPGEAAVGLVDVHAEVQRRKTRLLTELLGGVLIKRDAVAEAAARRVACGGEEAVLRAVTACDGWMREAAEDGEVASECREFLQIGRERVARAFVLREEMLG